MEKIIKLMPHSKIVLLHGYPPMQGRLREKIELGRLIREIEQGSLIQAIELGRLRRAIDRTENQVNLNEVSVLCTNMLT